MEKELFELISIHTGQLNGVTDAAKAIIAKYPQILAEKVWEDDTGHLSIPVGFPNVAELIPADWDRVQVFIREVK